VIYYTLDGSLPTTNSFRYAGAFNLFSNATVSANAFETSFNNSIAASALVFSCSPCISHRDGFLPNHSSNWVSSAAGSNYVLQATTNFSTWTPISTNTGHDQLFNLLDPKATNYPYRFYRVRQQ
jgi:hypothetical protein